MRDDITLSLLGTSVTNIDLWAGALPCNNKRPLMPVLWFVDVCFLYCCLIKFMQNFIFDHLFSHTILYGNRKLQHKTFPIKENRIGNLLLLWQRLAITGRFPCFVTHFIFKLSLRLKITEFHLLLLCLKIVNFSSFWIV